jgi:UDP-N-acetylmuramoylalanine--D-glutamate ligase
MRDWSGQKVVIVGAARQGLALARYLAMHGASVVLNDQRPLEALAAARQSLADLDDKGLAVEWVCGGHPLSLLDGANWLCPSGGVPLEMPLVVEAQRRAIPLSNDSQIFMEAAPCKVIGITGSAGKTTTTTLVGRMAQQVLKGLDSQAPYRRSWVGGNIGTPLLLVVDEMQPDDLAIMELSSFQLELMDRSPQIAAVLNVTPNHLDRHGTMEAYKAAKARLLAFQSADGTVILGRDDPGAWSLAEKAAGLVFSFGFSALPSGASGVFFADGGLYWRPGPGQADLPGEIRLIERRDIALRGDHNILNVMAACAIAIAAGLPVEAMRAGVKDFYGVSHRLEFVRRWGGADWYNDSIASAPERTMADIRSFDEPLVLLVGGRDKNLPWDDFAALAHQRVDHLIVFGEAAEIILQAVRPQAGERLEVVRCAGLKDAVQTASHLVQPGDVVLLSPGGTSFDEFKDFEERGECFARWVKELP